MKQTLEELKKEIKRLEEINELITKLNDKHRKPKEYIKIKETK